MLFVNREIFRLTENSGAGGKNNVFDPPFHGGVQDIDGPVDIVYRIFFRLNHGFPHGFESRQVDHCVKAPGARPGQAGIVQDVPMDEVRLGKKVPPVAAGKVIKNRYRMAPVQEFPDHMTADVPGAAND
jgi:hypothetical protein